MDISLYYHNTVLIIHPSYKFYTQKQYYPLIHYCNVIIYELVILHHIKKKKLESK